MSLHLEHLNPEQLAAVTLPDEHALVLAGAGSAEQFARQYREDYDKYSRLILDLRIKLD